VHIGTGMHKRSPVPGISRTFMDCRNIYLELLLRSTSLKERLVASYHLGQTEVIPVVMYELHYACRVTSILDHGTFL
jgi:hypothetical protein